MIIAITFITIIYAAVTLKVFHAVDKKNQKKIDDLHDFYKKKLENQYNQYERALAARVGILERAHAKDRKDAYEYGINDGAQKERREQTMLYLMQTREDTGSWTSEKIAALVEKM